MTLPGKILIIDDELTLRQTLARILQRAGFEVTTAENGEQGLAFLETTNFDLIYLDIRMPGLAGPEVLKLVHASHPTIPVVLFTAQPDINSALEALRSGATDYLLKPLKPDTIIERTKTILAREQKEQRKREIQAQIALLQTELGNIDKAEVAMPARPIMIPSPERYLKRGALVFDLHARRLSIGERLISLAPTSFDYLLTLARHAPEVVTYQMLVAEAQGFQADVREAKELSKWHIHHIRQALEPDETKPTYLFNVRGIGYRLLVD
jgi:two-component system, OmpR family, alkaline phosphatase synthesis response regulator PhoP